ncbi:cation transporter [Kineococcus arenarius]|uniref:cation transporter n=1 Tax=Kineococcus sp. SYSU DK007 TaxID=3383128 RepID=UPI003D7ED6F3
MIQDIQLTSGPTAVTGSGCACCTPADGAATSTRSGAVGSDGVRSSYGVAGMTCGHCVAAVRGELSALAGITDVEVDLVAGGTSTVTITATAPLEQAAVAAAVDEAGYALAAPPR